MSEMSTQLPLHLQLKDSARFENFVALRNEEALACLQACARDEGERFVYLWGRAGVGKTHLLQAVCHAAAAVGMTAAYVPLAQAGRLPSEFLEGFETMAVVCIDDLQAVTGDAAWERGLFNLFNGLRAAHARLVVAADGPPARIVLGLADLQSRLSSGLTLHLQPLDDAGTIAALKQRARARGLELPTDVAEYLLRRAPRDLGSLFEMLERLDRASLAAQRKLTIPFVRAQLSL